MNSGIGDLRRDVLTGLMGFTRLEDDEGEIYGLRDW